MKSSEDKENEPEDALLGSPRKNRNPVRRPSVKELGATWHQEYSFEASTSTAVKPSSRREGKAPAQPLASSDLSDASNGEGELADFSANDWFKGLAGVSRTKRSYLDYE